MAKVSNLNLRLQTGSSNTILATWDFNTTQKITTSTGAVRVGDWVNVKSGATWYNGVSIPSFVFSNGPWHVDEIIGVRAVLGRNQSGSNDIQSPINIANLTGVSGGTSTTTQVNTLDHYTYTWFYDTGDGVWFEGEHGDTQAGSAETVNRYLTYSPPDNYVRVDFHIIPVAKTRKVNGQDTAYWTGELVIGSFLKSSTPPEVPSVPTVEIEDYSLTATLDNITDARSDRIQFEVYDMTTYFTTGTVDVVAAMASFTCNVNAGGSYRVRARSANQVSSSQWVYSEWSDYATAVDTIPAPPTEITAIRGTSSTSVYLEWTVVNSAETYEIEYTTNVNYFDGSSETTSVTGIEFNHYEVTGLESGDEYFFRVRAVNAQGESAWTGIKSVVIGKPPAAPTTWSSSTTVITGETLNLYWVHNAEDGSREKYAELEIYFDGVKEEHTIENPNFDNEEEEDTTHFYSVDTTNYPEGTKIEWRVRTCGITLQYGDWSVMRTVDVYAPPTLSLSITDKEGAPITTLSSYPFFIKGLAGPSTQEPIGYSVSIYPNSGYTTTDEVGNAEIIKAGDLIYNEYIDTKDALLVELTAGDVDLQNGITYTVDVTVSMNSGLTAQGTSEFVVSWTDEVIPLDMQISIDSQSYVAYVTPYSRDPDTGELNAGYELMVYRREFDGTFKLIADGIDSSQNVAVTDPHPSLDYARYRIVARSNATGTISYYDPPGYPVGCTSIIIQWDEEWSNFDTTNTDVRQQPPWNGSLLELPYNVDVSDSISPDVEFVDYVGRTYPVSYYGSSVDSTSTWSTEIPATDVETIYALRRLQIWKGDCYVREPSGSGYWASIVVSFTKTHLELTIPVSISITRVEGGI